MRFRKLMRKRDASLARREIERFHDEFVVATIEKEVGDCRYLAIDDRRVLAHGRGTLKHTSWFQLAGTGVQLHTDVWRDHGAEHRNVKFAVYTKEDEH